MNIQGKSAISLKKILFAQDFSPSSLTAFPFVSSIAHHYDGKIIFAHITSNSQSVPADSIRASLDNMLAGAEEGLLASHGASGAPHELQTGYGSLCPALLSIAEKCSVDLIVIGTRGLAGFRKLLQGSKAEEIMCLSSKPVMIVGPKVSTTTNFRHILYATDCSATSLRALCFADSISNSYKSSLVVLHVNDGNSDEAPNEATSKTYDFLRTAHEQGLVESEKTCEVVVEFGPRAERILESANARSTDLIILGMHSRAGIRARIRAHLPGSVAYDVISKAHCPVLTVPS